MELAPWLLIVVILVHWLADFVFQTDKMAKSKSTNPEWLVTHVTCYALFLVPFGLMFAAVNFVAHLTTDFFSSQITSYFWRLERRHEFFVTIGLDQALHMIVLVLTFPLMDPCWTWMDG